MYSVFSSIERMCWDPFTSSFGWHLVFFSVEGVCWVPFPWNLDQLKHWFYSSYGRHSLLSSFERVCWDPYVRIGDLTDQRLYLRVRHCWGEVHFLLLQELLPRQKTHHFDWNSPLQKARANWPYYYHAKFAFLLHRNIHGMHSLSSSFVIKCLQ